MTRKEQAIEIRIKMMRNRVTPTQIRHSFKPPVSHTAIYNVIEGLSQSTRIKKAIAKAVKSTVEELWPEKDEEEERAA